MANLWLGQDAGSWHGQIDLGSYISGYVDGEGCFTVSISPRPTLSAGWEVRPSLSVSQNGDRAEVLLLIQRYFGCGRIRPDRSDRTVKWETRSLDPIRATVIPHFSKYPMLSGNSVTSSGLQTSANAWLDASICSGVDSWRSYDWPVR
jgi:hypothetical protein